MNKKQFIYTLLLSFIFNISILHAKNIDLSGKFIPLKDFILLKYDLFINNNLNNLIVGGGVSHISYESIQYDVSLDKKNNIHIDFNAIMNKKRYTAKKYTPKLSDCNQVRNKIFLNKSGYSFFKQTFNYMVNKDVLSSAVYKNILNISTLDNNLRKQILENTFVKVEIIHPKSEKNMVCSGKLISAELK